MKNKNVGLLVQKLSRISKQQKIKSSTGLFGEWEPVQLRRHNVCETSCAWTYSAQGERVVREKPSEMTLPEKKEKSGGNWNKFPLYLSVAETQG